MWQKFEPHPILRSGWWQTVVANSAFAAAPKLDNVAALRVKLDDGDHLFLHVDSPSPVQPLTPIVMLMHGLGGCSESAYKLRIAQHLVKRGYRVIRFNHRGAAREGGQEARGIYHSGRTDDLVAALAEVHRYWPQAPVALAAFSLSANMVLALLGKDPEIGTRYPGLKACLAVCPPIDLEVCSRALSRRVNRAIDKYYVRRLVHIVRQRATWFPDAFVPKFPKGLLLREFDEIYTAKVAGFRNREDYYINCSSKPVIRHIQVPTDILATSDDPLIPLASFAGLEMGAATRLHVIQGGGHMGLISKKPTHLGDRRWMDAAVVAWVEHRLPL